MEFSELGEHCKVCREKDFLPIKCMTCQFYFCKNHKFHGCESTTISTKVTVNANANDKKDRCNIFKCRNNMIYGTKCNDCQYRYCLEHRHHFNHKELNLRKEIKEHTVVHEPQIKLQSNTPKVVKPKHNTSNVSKELSKYKKKKKLENLKCTIL